MLKFCCLITGDDYNQLKNETPYSIKKVKLFVFCMILPVLLWALNSFLLASQVLGKDLSTAIIVMIVSALVILLIEKVIIMTNGNKYIATFRICLGIVIAALGSLSFDEVIFKNDIDTQISENKEVFVKDKLVIKQSELKESVLKIENEIKNKESEWKGAINEAIGEADGTGGSGIPNRGKITDLKLQKADEFKSEYEKTKSELVNMKNSNDSILKIYEDKLAGSYDENSLLLRIEALFDLVQKKGWAKIVYILFFLLIFFLEFMVIIVKLFSNESNYERKMKLIEETGEKRMRLIKENKSPLYDKFIFKGDLKSSTELIRRPVNGMFS